MENEFVIKFCQDIDDNVLLQLFHETSMVMEGEIIHFWLCLGACLSKSLLTFHCTN